MTPCLLHHQALLRSFPSPAIPLITAGHPNPTFSARLKGHLLHNDHLLPNLIHNEYSFLLSFLPLSLHQTLCFLLMTINNSVVNFSHYTLAMHYSIGAFLRIETVFFWLFLLIATIKANKLYYFNFSK